MCACLGVVQVLVKTHPGEVLGHEAIKEVEDEGMPIYGASHMFGVLYVQFDIKFPEKLELSEAQRKALAGILGGVPPTPSVGHDVEVKYLEEVSVWLPEFNVPFPLVLSHFLVFVRLPSFIRLFCFGTIQPNMEARKSRESVARNAYDSDEDEGGMPGGQRVQCAQG